MIQTQIIAPSLGDRSRNCQLARWFAEDASMVKAGDPIATIETKKATMDLVAEKAGVLHHRVREEDVVEFETSVGFIESDGLTVEGNTIFLTMEISGDELEALDRIRGELSRDEFASECLRKRLV